MRQEETEGEGGKEEGGGQEGESTCTASLRLCRPQESVRSTQHSSASRKHCLSPEILLHIAASRPPCDLFRLL